jgi:SAM-dependent methyltransferase
MRSLAEIAALYETDKASSPGYLGDFEEVFGQRRQSPTAILELGIFRGGSLQLWRDYFSSGLVVGLDLNSVDVSDPSGRIRTYVGSQADRPLLDRIRAEAAPEGFDIIIDDCSHLGQLTSASFWHLYPNHLRPGGVYVVEDWGTGYWDSWPDGRHAAAQVVQAGPRERSGGMTGRLARRLGRGPGPIGRLGRRLSRALPPPRLPSHDYGMVGFVKQLIDECAMPDVTAPGRGGLQPYRPSSIAKMRISTGHVFVFKPEAAAQAATLPVSP